MSHALLVRDGHVVTEAGVLEAADVLIEDGRIRAIGRGLPRAPDVLDASGHYVLPGAVDPHVHVSQDGASLNEPMLDDLEAASRGALLGGTTAIGVYVQRTSDVALLEMIHRQIEVGRDTAYTDFAINALCLPGDDVAGVVEEASRELGVTTFKALLAYRKQGLMTDEDQLLLLMRAVAGVGATVLVHAENGKVMDGLEELARGEAGGEDRLLASAPGELEADGMFRTAMLARLTGARVLFVHLTSAIGRDTLRWLRTLPGGERLSVETQPHYALLTNEQVTERGALGKVGPVLKREHDRVAVAEALSEGLVSHLSSDHAPRSSEVKLKAPDILDAPYGGTSGTELLLPLAWKLGVQDGLFDVARLAQLTATNAARRYGLYPDKGTIRPGSAGDLALVPIEGRTRVISPETLHMSSDYSLYQGIESAGFPSYVVKAGQTVVADGELLARPRPRYLART